MDIIKEIAKISKQVDEITGFLGEFKNMTDILSGLQAELTRAKNLVSKSKDAIILLKTTVQAHEATIANQASQIATHVETLASSVSANVVTSVTTDFHNVLSELESFLTSEVSTNTVAVPLSQTANLTTNTVLNNIVAPAPIFVPVAQTVTNVVSNTVVSPAAVTIDEVTAEIQSLHDNILGTANTPAAVNVVSVPIQSVEEIEALYHALESNMQHNSDPLIDPRLAAVHLLNNPNVKLG